MVGRASSKRRGRYYLEAPLRRPALVLAPVALLALACFGAALLRPARYRAAVLLEVEARDADEALLAQRGIDVASQRSRLMRDRVTEPGLVDKLVQELQPYPNEGTPSAAPGAQARQLRAELQVRSISSSSFVVEFVHHDPAMAAAVANHLAVALVASGAAAAPDSLLEARVVEAHRLLSEKAMAAGRVAPPPPLAGLAETTPRPPAPRASAESASPVALEEYDQAQRAYQRLLEEWQAAAKLRAQSAGAPSAGEMRFQLLRAAAIPEAPEPRRPILLALLGALAGLVGGLVVALVAEYRDRTLKGPEHLQEIVSAPLLAMVPEARARDLRD